MKKIIPLILSLVMMLSFTACGTKAEATWQEHYDLGLKYVNEAKYDEAVLEFTKALEIDPKQAPVYIALAEVYVRQENYTAAQETLDKAITEIGETDELNKVRDIAVQPQQDEAITENEPVIVRSEKTEFVDGSKVVFEYDENDNMVKKTLYNADGSIDCWWINECDENGNIVKQTTYNADGYINMWLINEYNENGNILKQTFYNADGIVTDITEF